jgi:hypothetical protein
MSKGLIKFRNYVILYDRNAYSIVLISAFKDISFPKICDKFYTFLYVIVVFTFVYKHLILFLIHYGS